MITNKEEAIDHFHRQLERNQFGDSIHAQALRIAVNSMEQDTRTIMERFREFIKGRPMAIDRSNQEYLIGIDGRWQEATEAFIVWEGEQK